MNNIERDVEGADGGGGAGELGDKAIKIKLR
jgi:hypothetical protein